MVKNQRDAKGTEQADKSPRKTGYRVSNWAAYNDSLVQRSSATVWIRSLLSIA